MRLLRKLAMTFKEYKKRYNVKQEIASKKISPQGRNDKKE